MIKVIPYIRTAGNEKFKNFLILPFNFDQLYSLSGEQSLFWGWKGKNMETFLKYTNDDKIILEVYADKYIISKIGGNINYGLKLPRTINHFINDMEKYGVQLYWGDWIDEQFEPKDYLHKDEIKEYYIDLLAKLDKSNELQ